MTSSYPFFPATPSPLLAGLSLSPAAGFPSGVSLAMNSGNSTPPMSFMICIIGGIERAMLCRKLVVLLVPLAWPLPPEQGSALVTGLTFAGKAKRHLRRDELAHA